MAGYSVLGFYPVDVMNSLSSQELEVDLLIFGYVRVAHWAAIDGRPQHWTKSTPKER